MLAILVQLIAGQPAIEKDTGMYTNTTSNTPDDPLKSWAAFCNDDNCTEGCGEWVDITNTGCLAENYRRSLKFKSDYRLGISGGLVYSPGDSCNCQSECDTFSFPGDSGCMTLNTTISYETFSYRLGNPCTSSGNEC